MTDLLLSRRCRTAGPVALVHLLPFLGFALLLFALPLLGLSRGTTTLVNLMGINIVLALSYNMLLGRAGLLSFGHAVYFALGGFFCVHLINRIGAETGIWAHLPVFFVPIFGFGFGLIAGAIIGWPSCKRAGTAFAMISLGIAEMIGAGAHLFDSLFGGEVGVSADRMVGPRVAGLSLGPVSEVYWFIAFWTFIAVVAMYAFTRTPLGQLGEAARDNPQRTEFLGYDPKRVRYMIFIVACGFAGLAGGMAAVQNEIFTITSFALPVSGAILISAYLGGTRYFMGPALGAIFLTYLQSSLSDYSHAWMLYVGIVFIATVAFAPNGLAGLIDAGWRGLRGPTPAHFFAVALLRGLAAAAFMLAIILCAEVVFHWSQGYGDIFTPMGLPMPHNSVLTWLLGAALIALGSGLLAWLSARDRRI